MLVLFWVLFLVLVLALFCGIITVAVVESSQNRLSIE